MALETDVIGKRRQSALDTTDGLPSELKACAHEFGLPVVTACLKYGVKKPNQIRDLVREIWDGPRVLGQPRHPLSTLDWVLIQAGCPFGSASLIRILEDHNYCIVPKDPSAEMLEASMAEVSSFNERITKREKHRRRLRAANLAGCKQAASWQR